MRHILCAAIAASFALAMPAYAATPEEVARAERLYQDGLSAFRAGEHERAATFFRASWNLVPKSELLYNEAIAWGRHGDISRALDAATEAETDDLPQSMRDRNSARRIAWQLHQTASSTAALPIAVAPEPVEVIAEEEAAALPAPQRPIAPLIVGSTGVVALLGAGVIELALAGRGSELQRATDPADYADTLAGAKRLQTAGRVLAVTGTALAAAGLVLYLWPREQAASVRVTAHSLAFRARF